MSESWIKVHTDVLHDPKILRLHPISRYAWIGLLLLCRTGNPPGTWKAASRESVAADLCLALRIDDPLGNDTEPLAGGDFQMMVDSRMISVSDSGLVTVKNWSARQGSLKPSSSPEQTRARQRLSRMSRHVTPGHTRSRGEEKRVEEKDQKQLPSVERPTAPPDLVSVDGAPNGNDRTRTVTALLDFWRFWVERPQAKLTADRRQKVNARLSEGYSPLVICRAIVGLSNSPFHRGENERGKVYDDIELICRRGSKLEQFTDQCTEEKAREAIDRWRRHLATETTA